MKVNCYRISTMITVYLIDDLSNVRQSSFNMLLFLMKRLGFLRFRSNVNDPFEALKTDSNILTKFVVEKAKNITVKTFLTDVLPNAISLKVKLNTVDGIYRINVPIEESNTIFIWDRESERRDYCTLVTNNGSHVSNYGLNGGWNDVEQVTPTPWTISISAQVFQILIQATCLSWKESMTATTRVMSGRMEQHYYQN